MNVPPDRHDDLLFEAFRYAADEMSAAERSQFEQRLADDQAAREAVARAVQISQAVAALPVETVGLPHRPAPWSRRLGWVAALALGLCLAFLIGWLLPPHADDETSEAQPLTMRNVPTTLSETGSGAAAADLVALWLGTGSGTHAAESEAAALDALAVPAPEPFLVAEADLTVPDWMLAAVSAEIAAEAERAGGRVQEN